jgi:heterotetrameric sarcosine oxidase gamma subunit
MTRREKDCMADLGRMQPQDQFAAIAAPGVAIRVLDPAGQFYVTGGPDLAPNARVGTDPCSLWLAPDRALVVCAAQREVPQGAFVSDVTDGLVLIEIAGPRAPDIIAAATTLDRALLAAGRCAQTLFGGVKVVLYADGENFRLHVERPFAAFLLAWLAQAASALKETN